MLSWLPTLHLAPGSVVGLVHCWPGRNWLPSAVPFIPPLMLALRLRAKVNDHEQLYGGSQCSHQPLKELFLLVS